jgi:hypothetical protein
MSAAVRIDNSESGAEKRIDFAKSGAVAMSMRGTWVGYRPRAFRCATSGITHRKPGNARLPEFSSKCLLQNWP